jgi:hypothetical protein
LQAAGELANDAAMAGSGTLGASGEVLAPAIYAAAAFSGEGSMGSQPRLSIVGGTDLDGDGILSVTTTQDRGTGVDVGGQGGMFAHAGVICAAGAHLDGRGNLVAGSRIHRPSARPRKVWVRGRAQTSAAVRGRSSADTDVNASGQPFITVRGRATKQTVEASGDTDVNARAGGGVAVGSNDGYIGVTKKLGDT